MATATASRGRPPRSWWSRHGLQVVVNGLALLPLVITAVQIATGTIGVDLVAALTSYSGTAALVLLLLSLACTPVNTVFGWRWALPLRRTLGLYAAFYALLHLLVFTVLDYGLNLGQLQEAVLEKRYALAGMASFLVLAALAVTSTKGMMRRLGKNWKRLHQLVYVAAALAVVHFLWLVKIDLTEPLIFAAVLGVLLVLRVPAVKRSITQWRQSRTRANSR